MKKLFDKKEDLFAVLLIVIYVVVSMLLSQVSEKIGIDYLAEGVFYVIYTAFLAIFIAKNNIAKYIGLCKSDVKASKMLFYIPLMIVGAVGVIFGFAPQYKMPVIVVHTLVMPFTGFIEEVIFRGFLFKALAKKNIKIAVIVSAVTFGIGHIVNLFNGYDLTENILQIIYAVGVGFLLVFVYMRTGSIWYCIIFHAFNNVCAGFGSAELLVKLGGSEQMGSILNVTIRLVITAIYLVYVIKFVPKRPLTQREDNLSLAEEN